MGAGTTSFHFTLSPALTQWPFSTRTKREQIARAHNPAIHLSFESRNDSGNDYFEFRALLRWEFSCGRNLVLPQKRLGAAAVEIADAVSDIDKADRAHSSGRGPLAVVNRAHNARCNAYARYNVISGGRVRDTRGEL